MNWHGIITGICCFIMIGLFHPIVIKCEYYFSKRIWPIFLAAGMVSASLSVLLNDIWLSIIFGVLACSCFWSIHELFEQERRVQKGWFPKKAEKRSGK